MNYSKIIKYNLIRKTAQKIFKNFKKTKKLIFNFQLKKNSKKKFSYIINANSEFFCPFPK